MSFLFPISVWLAQVGATTGGYVEKNTRDARAVRLKSPLSI